MVTASRFICANVYIPPWLQGMTEMEMMESTLEAVERDRKTVIDLVERLSKVVKIAHEMRMALLIPGDFNMRATTQGSYGFA